MIKTSPLKFLSQATAVAAVLLLSGVVHAQGAGSPGAGTNAVENGAAPAPGMSGAGPAADTASATKPMKAKKPATKASKSARPMGRTKQQPTVGTGPTEDPSRIKP